jgi:succinate dehydrogenase / fumarate reductase flavoprotein subunit
MKIYPAAHYTMGGLWVDYHLMSNIPGLFVIGEANFSDHGANRLGASALMQGLADGYFILPQTIGHYFAESDAQPLALEDEVFDAAEQDATRRINCLLEVAGTQTVASLHRQLGDIMWHRCGMSRRGQDLLSAIDQIKELRDNFWQSVNVTGTSRDLNQALEYAGRVADFMEFAELMCRDALAREESCGAHFREEYQNNGEARRDDERFSHVAAWAYRGEDLPMRFEEKLAFECAHLMERDYR